VSARPLPMVVFAAFAALAIAAWWFLGAPSHADTLRVHSVSVDT